MSWSARYRVENGNWEPIFEPSNIGQVYTHDQFQAAQSAAITLIEIGVVGDSAGKFVVNLSGHGNPEHKPLSGWSDDFITLSVYQER